MGLGCVVMSWRTVIRNTDWQDNIPLSIASARDNLRSAKACYWAGITLVNAAPQPWMEEFGEKLLERAATLYPEYGESYWELAKYWGRKQEFVKSVELLAKATTTGYQLDAARGLITWTLNLVNGEWRNVDLAFAIHLPEGWQVPGR